MPASPSSLIASLSRAPAGLCPQEVTADLPAALAAVPDPRARRGIRHRLTVVVTAAICAVAAGYRSHTRDVTYDEDRCQIRTGTGPQVMAPYLLTPPSARFD